MDMGTLLVLLLLLLAMNALVRNQLIASTGELRMRIAEEAKRLLASEHLGEQERRNVETACEVSFVTGVMWLVAIILPFYFVYAVVFDRQLLEDDSKHIEDAQTRVAYMRVRAWALFSAMTFSPFFSLVVLAEMVVLRLLSKPFLGSVGEPTGQTEAPPVVLRAEEWLQRKTPHLAFSGSIFRK